MSAGVIKLKDVAKPIVRLELHDGEVVEIDPFVFCERTEALPLDTKSSDFHDSVRRACGLPTEAESVSTGKATLAPHECIVVIQGIMEFVEGLDYVKKLKSMQPS